MVSSGAPSDPGHCVVSVPETYVDGKSRQIWGNWDDPEKKPICRSQLCVGRGQPPTATYPPLSAPRLDFPSWRADENPPRPAQRWRGLSYRLSETGVARPALLAFVRNVGQRKFVDVLKRGVH